MKTKVLGSTVDPPSKVQIWFQSLSTLQRDELASLDYHSADDPLLRCICEDWIEEHGGERKFWMCLYTY